MKKLLFFLLVAVITVPVFAQDNKPLPEHIEKFYNSKTYFVLDDNIMNVYNNAIKAAAKLNWTITPYEFITISEFEQKRKNPNNSFVVRTKAMFADDKEKISYTFLSLLMGKTMGNIDKMPDLCEFPASYYNVDYDRYDYKLPAILLFMQNHMEWLKENPKIGDMSVANHYRKQKNPTKDKTLYLIKDELDKDVNTEEKIAKVYTGKIKIVTAEEIKEVIDKKDKDAIFLHKVGSGESFKKARCFNLIIGASDAKIYYFNYHTINDKKNPDAFLKSDFKSIEKQ